jgi:hypothetical protein
MSVTPGRRGTQFPGRRPRPALGGLSEDSDQVIVRGPIDYRQASRVPLDRQGGRPARDGTAGRGQPDRQLSPIPGRRATAAGCGRDDRTPARLQHRETRGYPEVEATPA